MHGPPLCTGETGRRGTGCWLPLKSSSLECPLEKLEQWNTTATTQRWNSVPKFESLFRPRHPVRRDMRVVATEKTTKTKEKKRWLLPLGGPPLRLVTRKGSSVQALRTKPISELQSNPPRPTHLIMPLGSFKPMCFHLIIQTSWINKAIPPISIHPVFSLSLWLPGALPRSPCCLPGLPVLPPPVPTAYL